MELWEERYIAFTTYRRTGEPVTSPVWIAPLSRGRAGFTTGGTSGKVKRLGHTPSVTLQPCNARGDITIGTQPTRATARVVSDADPAFSDVRAAIHTKYGWQVRAINAAGKISGLLRRKASGMAPDAAVVIDLDGTRTDRQQTPAGSG
ncbi:MAG: PPOX class F420-dependent oxidoreductase [Ornithinimicrobium sp.]